MIVVDEYLAIRAFVGDLPTDVPDDFLGIPVSAHWRLLQRLHSGGDGQLSRLPAQLPEADREALRTPHPHMVEVPDPRPLLDEAARISAGFCGTGWLIAESVTAALHHGRQLWYGSERNIGGRLREIADELGIDVRVAR
jgi:hypothetical protein